MKTRKRFFFKAVGQLQASWRIFFFFFNSKSGGFCNCNARSLPLSLSLSPLLKAIQPRLAGSQILSGLALCALDCTRLCRSCNRFAVPPPSPCPLVYFRNRCNLHSNHALGGGGGREGAGKRPCPLLPSSCLSPRQSPPPPRRVANRSPGIQRKLRSGHRSEESPCVTRPGSRDGVFGAVGVPPLEDLAAGTREL